jgi:phytoene dehydrogenase-like protein
VSLPVEKLKRKPPTAECDVVVVGAGLAGLVCAATLASSGRRVVLVDRAKRPGGRLQTVNFQGFAIDLGPVLWEAGLVEILEGLGIEEHGLVALSPRATIGVSVLGPDGAAAAPCALPVPGAVPAPSTLDAVRQLYDAPPRLFAALGEVYQEWSTATPEQLEQWQETPMEVWLEERAFEPGLAAAIRRSAVLLGGSPEASLVVLAGLARALADDLPTHLTVGDTPIAGARGVVQSLVDLIIEAGGDLRLGTRAIGVGLERGRFTQLAMRREETPFIEELAAERLVLALPPSETAALLPPEPRAALERLLPAAVAERELSVAWGINGETTPSFPRSEDAPVAIRLTAPPRAKPEDVPAAGATLIWSTVAAPRLAPPGTTLVRAVQSVPPELASDLVALEERVAALRAALHGLVPGAVEATAWEHCWLAESPAAVALRPPELPLVAPGLSGVLLAGQEVAVAGSLASGITAAAVAGRAAASRILAEGSAIPDLDSGESDSGDDVGESD